MINKIRIGVVAAAMLMTGNVVAGQPGSNYGGIQYVNLTYSMEDDPIEFSANGLSGRLGNYVNENFSLEGRLGIGLSDDSASFSNVYLEGGYYSGSITVKPKTLIGVYGVGHAVINETLSVYALAGMTKVEATLSVTVIGLGSVSYSENDTGLSFGAGVDIGVTDTTAINIEYVQYLSESDYDVDAFSVGVKFGF